MHCARAIVESNSDTNQPTEFDRVKAIKKSGIKPGSHQQTKLTEIDNSFLHSFHRNSCTSYIQFPIESLVEEVHQNPPPNFLLWTKWPLINTNRSEYNFKKRKKRFSKILKLLNQWERPSSIFICPFCEIENYMIKIL
jgi:hypothetical protein